MNLGRVKGKVWATRKYDTLKRRRMLIVQPLSFTGKRTGSEIVALDTVDAGEGDAVLYVSSSEASIPFLPEPTPAAATIVGVVDRIDHTDGSWVP